MTSIRLLPIVIFAAAALLVFKGIGLVTQGGYVLVGTSIVEAAGGGGGHGGGGGEGGGAEGGAAGDTMLVEHAASDAAPTLDDGSPTLALTPEPAAGGGHSAPAAGEGEVAADAGAAHGGAAAEAPIAAEVACAPDAAAPADGAGGGAHGGSAADAAAPCVPATPTIAEGDAIPMMQDAQGNIVPVSDQTDNQAAVLERLGERRTALDAREKDIATQMALIDAAEKRLNEKAALLEKLQTQIDGLVDQNKTSDDEQFKGLIATYEAMKPKDAANILNELDLNTLLRVAKGIQPRKMAPIMAKMDPTKAKDLTAALAMAPVEPTVAVTQEDIANLPQIVGQ